MLFLPGAAAFASTIPEKGASESGVRMGIVFDCGSSGTRAHYFTWDSSAPDQLEEVEAPNGSIKVAPGISDFAVGQGCDESGDSNHDGVCDQLLVNTTHPACPTNTACNLTIDQYIQPLLDQATDQAAIWKDLAAAASTTDFDFKAEDAFTLAGDYEGIFGWLAVQSIAFEPEDGVITENGVAVMHSEYSTQPRTSYVYSISYMLSGQDQGQLRVAQYLYNQSSAVDEVANPCFNPGYNKSMQVCEGIALGSSSTCSGPKRDVMFVGTGDYEECRGVIEAAG
ncbi:hypothetical protein EMIHUDRAFT_208241 [Emiliania huxleyi CCMP1516]|uniref:Uncharacterized protein n=2 Tax=Emiliania huxleyi TaxID=2903 RepID=A0A0D3JA77_EMIH1|nr:hypothetical protein EMIHUDRAFT_208241 [Emiliania huxleyi CCMP1516]EOD20412.1 hypothetical protein EMIHUDRAFT_208241 [Emiliania huxleyi CCMP1516]|eukprot:XP_005772841.1 hypothetical protein EMIHUDRAFT_208241 [Emiliania huxleyi CCMP1516]